MILLSTSPSTSCTHSDLSRHIRSINIGRALPATPQHRRDGDRRAQLGRKARPGARSAGSRILVLAEADVCRVGLVRFPDAPAGGVDDVRHGGILECDARILTPGAAEVV